MSQIISNETFFHITHTLPYNTYNRLEVGKDYFIGNSQNPFFNFFDMAPIKNTEALMFIRETVFEEIRQSYFPTAPSRTRCIWVIKNNPIALDYWKKELGTSNRTLLKLKLNGKIHKANEKYLHLNPNGDSLNTLRQKAFLYWSEMSTTTDEEPSCEYLFEGFITVAEQINF